MALIRQSDSLAANSRAIRLDLGDLVRQGESIVASARVEADRILASAKIERERLLDDATRAGHAEGFAKGLAEGRAKGESDGHAAALAEIRPRLAHLDADWTAALRHVSDTRDAMLAEARQEVLRLAIDIARLVVKRDLALHPERVVDQLSSVLASIVRPTRLIVRVHPDDAPIVKEALPEMMRRYASAAHVEVAEDSTLDRGSVVAGLPSGAGVDGSISGQISRLVESLMPSEPGGATTSVPAAPASPSAGTGDSREEAP
jgi:flagellar assembly protein FliH